MRFWLLLPVSNTALLNHSGESLHPLRKQQEIYLVHRSQPQTAVPETLVRACNSGFRVLTQSFLMFSWGKGLEAVTRCNDVSVVAKLAKDRQSMFPSVWSRRVADMLAWARCICRTPSFWCVHIGQVTVLRGNRPVVQPARVHVRRVALQEQILQTRCNEPGISVQMELEVVGRW